MSDDLVVWLRKRFINEKEWYGVEVDGLTDAADRIEALESLIQEMREALEIAQRFISSVPEVVTVSGDAALYAVDTALSKAKSQQEVETE